MSTWWTGTLNVTTYRYMYVHSTRDAYNVNSGVYNVCIRYMYVKAMLQKLSTTYVVQCVTTLGSGTYVGVRAWAGQQIKLIPFLPTRRPRLHMHTCRMGWCILVLCNVR